MLKGAGSSGDRTDMPRSKAAGQSQPTAKQALPTTSKELHSLKERFVNRLMMSGKKSLARYIFLKSLDALAKLNSDTKRVDSDASSEAVASDLFLRAVENVKPLIELKSKRVAGSTYKIPFQINSYRQYSLAIRWLILASRQRPERSMVKKLAAELYDAANSRGHAIKKRIETHRAAEANRAYLHYRW